MAVAARFFERLAYSSDFVKKEGARRRRAFPAFWLYTFPKELFACIAFIWWRMKTI